MVRYLGSATERCIEAPVHRQYVWGKITPILDDLSAKGTITPEERRKVEYQLGLKIQPVNPETYEEDQKAYIRKKGPE
jgi:hypothetical protein